MKINWEQLKRKAQLEFNSRLQMGYPFPTDTMFLALVAACSMEKMMPKTAIRICDEWSNYGNKLIENWDIRKCMALVKCFPSSLPKHLQSKSPCCDYDENGNWALFFE